jgi:hypothetical protein
MARQQAEYLTEMMIKGLNPSPNLRRKKIVGSKKLFLLHKNRNL